MYIRAIPKYILPGISYGGRLVAFGVGGRNTYLEGSLTGKLIFLLPQKKLILFKNSACRMYTYFYLTNKKIKSLGWST